MADPARVPLAGPDRTPVAIVGRGLSGIASAIALLRQVPDPLHLDLIDPRLTFGGGTAYGRAARPGDLLNVRARDLSVLAGEKGDFAEWLVMQGHGPRAGAAERQAAGDRFAPRALFGAYVAERFDTALARRPDCSVSLIDDAVTGLVPDPAGWRLACGTSPGRFAAHVILATGYGAGTGRPRFGVSPWVSQDPDRLKRLKRVVIVGSGLTMVDALLGLRAAGCTADILIISRRGLLPQPHCQTAQRPAPWVASPGTRINGLMRAVRGAARQALAEGRSWQGELNRLRPAAQEIWMSLPEADRARFFRHLRRWWDAHRHRLPPETHARLLAELGSGRTRIIAGEVRGLTGAEVRLRRFGTAAETILPADMVIDCSGFAPDTADPLVADLIARSLARPDPHGIGLSLAPDGQPEGAATPPGALHIIGPLGQGSLLEITAVPEIVAQASRAATAIGHRIARRALPAAGGRDLRAD